MNIPVQDWQHSFFSADNNADQQKSIQEKVIAAVVARSYTGSRKSLVTQALPLIQQDLDRYMQAASNNTLTPDIKQAALSAFRVLTLIGDMDSEDMLHSKSAA